MPELVLVPMLQPVLVLGHRPGLIAELSPRLEFKLALAAQVERLVAEPLLQQLRERLIV